MSDLLVRDIEDDLKRLIEDSARSHRRSLSEEVKVLLREKLVDTNDNRKLGTAMFDFVRAEDRGDDFIFEIPGEASAPPDFE